jgi:hypothetical protein
MVSSRFRRGRQLSEARREPARALAGLSELLSTEGALAGSARTQASTTDSIGSMASTSR